MGIAAPRRPVEDEDYQIECQEALEPYVIKLLEDIGWDGRPQLEAAEQLISAAMNLNDDLIFAQVLRQIVGWAVMAGWDRKESERAVRQLTANLYRAAGQNRLTDDGIARTIRSTLH